MNRRKSKLDEQQERKLLEIESRGCWLAFWGLLAAFVVQVLVFRNLFAFIGEGILLIGLSFYLGISCVQAGIWDRRMDMSRKTCLFLSLITGLCFAVFLVLRSLLLNHNPIDALRIGAIFGFVTFICYLALVLTARATKKRQDELNAEPNDDLDETDTH